MGAKVTKRKPLSKGLRFDVFRRDRFTCQYCGEQPPNVVLEVDHIVPVVDGGDNDILNLVAACRPCNRGKGKKRLEQPSQVDADLVWLETQQEIAELRAYQEAKQERDAAIEAVVVVLQGVWTDSSGLDWFPAGRVVRQMLARYAPSTIESAFTDVSMKVAGGYQNLGKGDNWLPYTWGVLRKMEEGMATDAQI